MAHNRRAHPSEEVDPAGADEHYRDAGYYDHIYRRYKPDLTCYVDLARFYGGPVLELGAGTGRVSLALAEAGIDVVGLDRMPNMLARARKRASKRPRRIQQRLHFEQADIRHFSLNRQFPLIIAPFNVFAHLYNRGDVENTLASIREHLTEGGVLAFDVLMPDHGAFVRDPDKFYKCRSVKMPEDGRRYAYSEAFDYDPGTQTQTVRMRFIDIEDETRRFEKRLVQRQFFPMELEALLHYNHFRLIRHEGGFRSEPLDPWADSQFLVATQYQATTP